VVDNFLSIDSHHTNEVVAHALSCLRMVEGGVAVSLQDGSVLASMLLLWP